MKRTSGSWLGTFDWCLDVNDNFLVKYDGRPAPDGELYAAFALFNAAARWGNGGGVLNYEAKANDILDAVKNHLMDASRKQVIF